MPLVLHTSTILFLFAVILTACKATLTTPDSLKNTTTKPQSTSQIPTKFRTQRRLQGWSGEASDLAWQKNANQIDTLKSNLEHDGERSFSATQKGMLTSNGETRTMLRQNRKEKVVKWWTQAKKVAQQANPAEFYIFRYVYWYKTKQTPEMIYEKLKIAKRSPWDLEYRLYVGYVRFYERLQGPAKSKLFVETPPVPVNSAGENVVRRQAV